MKIPSRAEQLHRKRHRRLHQIYLLHSRPRQEITAATARPEIAARPEVASTAAAVRAGKTGSFVTLTRRKLLLQACGKAASSLRGHLRPRLPPQRPCITTLAGRELALSREWFLHPVLQLQASPPPLGLRNTLTIRVSWQQTTIRTTSTTIHQVAEEEQALTSSNSSNSSSPQVDPIQARLLKVNSIPSQTFLTLRWAERTQLLLPVPR